MINQQNHMNLPTKTLRLLPADYQPTQFTAVVAKGHVAANALGNKSLRQLIHRTARAYSAAETKSGKSSIVSNILKQVKGWNDDGVGFVKYHENRWYECTDIGARDIISARFRDALHEYYKSSVKCKVAKRRISKASTCTKKCRSKAKVAVIPAMPFSDPSSSSSPTTLGDIELEPIPIDCLSLSPCVTNDDTVLRNLIPLGELESMFQTGGNMARSIDEEKAKEEMENEIFSNNDMQKVSIENQPIKTSRDRPDTPLLEIFLDEFCELENDMLPACHSWA